MAPSGSLTSRVADVRDTSDGKLVIVEVVGPTGAADGLRTLRARGNAIVSQGVLGPSVSSVTNIRKERLTRLTTEVSDPDRRSSGVLTDVTTHKILVRG